jgi:repressor LexA
MDMTDREKIISFYFENNRVPTYEEMKVLFDVASKSTVAYKVGKLVEEGVLAKEGKKLTMVNPGTVLMLGTVQAGFPSPAEEATMTPLSLDRMLIKRRGQTYMLEVQGESMKEAGILDGDLVIVEKNKKPARGDIVLALVENEYTLKYLQMERGKPVLVPANRRYKKIYPNPSRLKIEAVASAIIRKF